MSARISLDEIEAIARRALLAHGASAVAADSLARAIAATEAEGLASHGLAYLPAYCAHLDCGKVIGGAVPLVSHPRPGLVLVDAGAGFAHPAIEAGMEPLIAAAQSQGVAALALSNSYNCGVLGYHTERLAARGLVALGFTNAPASIAPFGATKPVLGTNPFSLAVPGEAGQAAFVIDQSASVVAKSEVMKRGREGRALEPGWALDADGHPTTDPQAALKGTMAPAGGYKGVGAALLTEVMAACLTGATPGIAASPFSGTQGGPPRTGQMFVAFAPDATSGGAFAARLAVVIEAFAGAGARLPGAKRLAARTAARRDGVAVSDALLAQVRALAG